MLKKSIVIALVSLSASSAHALPALQLYIEGATFDDATQTWVAPTGNTLRLWTIGAVGEKGPINDVKLSVAYAHGLTPTITLTGSSTGGYNGFVDPSTPSDPTLIQTVTDGSLPELGDGDPLPQHGIFNSDPDWQEFALGNFNLTDSKITDFNGLTDSPAPDPSKSGQINVYEFSISGVDEGTEFHFDLYDHYYSTNHVHYKFAPFSHDGETTTVPEPGTLGLMGVGAAGLVARLRKRGRK